MAKPTTLPTWATGGSADIVVPSAGKQALGWLPGEKPAAQYDNWFKKLVYQWLAYFNDHEIWLPPSAAMQTGGLPSTFKGHQESYSLRSSSAGDAYFRFPLIFPVGFVLNELKIYMIEPNLAGEEIIGTLSSVDPTDGTLTGIGGQKDSGVTGTYASMGWTSADSGIPLTFASGLVYFLAITLQQTSADEEAQILGIEINP